MTMNPDTTDSRVPSTPTPPPEGAGSAGATQPDKPSKKRRGVVLVAVLVVVTSLSLAGYHFSDTMSAQHKASEYTHRQLQAKAFAESGIWYAAAMLSNQNNYNGVLNGNPWNNPQAFQAQPIQADSGLGYFSIIAPANLDDGSSLNVPIYGVSDEGGKINVNTIMKIDPTGQSLQGMLLNLPNMTEDIANNIVAWLGEQFGIQNGGAQSDYYGNLNPPYRSKNGPIDHLDELLLVKGVTRDLLYGADFNRNGYQDNTSSEVNSNGFDRGWSAYITCYSREMNADQNNNPYVYLMNDDLQQLYSQLGSSPAGISDDLAKFIIMYRQYGPASGTTGKTQSLGGTLAALFGGGSSSKQSGGSGNQGGGGSQSGSNNNSSGGGGGSNSNSTTVQGTLSNYQLKFTKSGSTQITSMFDLFGASVSIQSVDPNNKNKVITTIYQSPLNDPTTAQTQMAALFGGTTLVEGPEIPARININTAPKAVLAALPGLAQTDVENIYSARQQASLDSAAWLVTGAQLNITTLRQLENYITARTQVYRIQSVGYFDGGKGPSARVEAVIDTNAGRPRILMWRDLSELGKGWTDPNTGN
jgi:type II secretory pathway component PulK